MSDRCRALGVGWCLVCTALCSWHTAAGQVPAPQLDRVFADWKQRAEKTLAVRYISAGEAILPKGGLMNYIDPRPKTTLPPRDIVMKIKRTFLLEFAGNRHRLEYEEHRYDWQHDQLHPRTATMVFDGVQMKSWRRRESNTHPLDGVRPGDAELGVSTGHLSAMEATYWPYLFGHGRIGSRDTGLVPGKLNFGPEKALLYVHGKGVHRDRNCLVLRTRTLRGAAPSFDEYWVDMDRQSAVVRYVLNVKGKPLIDMDVIYQDTAHGWLPREWTITRGDTNGPGATGAVDYTERIRVLRLELDPGISDRDFEIEERPGTLIQASTFSAPMEGKPPREASRRNYRVADDGSRFEVLVENGVERRVMSHWWWLGGALLALVSLSGSWAIWARWRKRA